MPLRQTTDTGQPGEGIGMVMADYFLMAAVTYMPETTLANSRVGCNRQQLSLAKHPVANGKVAAKHHDFTELKGLGHREVQGQR